MTHDDLDPEVRSAAGRVRAWQDEALAARRGVDIDALVGGATRPRSKRRAAVWILLAATLSFALAVLIFVRRDIAFRVDGVAGAADALIEARAAAVVVDFDEGSRVLVSPGSRARVGELDPRGASLVLERGSLDVRIVPRPGNAWRVHGGPFVISVVGTEFDVTWEDTSGSLTVLMRKGTVDVTGACLAAPRRLNGEDRATIRCEPDAEVAASAVARAGGPSTPTAPPPGTFSASASPSASAPVERMAAWRQLLASAKLREAFADAEVVGLESVRGTATARELVDLGSGARLAGNGAAASMFYLAARERFAGSDAAALAAYHLGRAAFDGRGAWAEAERWFAVYLAERPGGALAAEALGRSLECATRQGDATRARTLASRYLDLYPAGAHAPIARSALDGD